MRRGTFVVRGREGRWEGWWPEGLREAGRRERRKKGERGGGRERERRRKKWIER